MVVAAVEVKTASFLVSLGAAAGIASVFKLLVSEVVVVAPLGSGAEELILVVIGAEVVVTLLLGVVEGIGIVVYSIRNPPPFTLESDLNLKIGT